MNSKRMLSAFIFLILQTNLLFMAQSICLNNGNYTPDSTYKQNLITALMSLPSNLDNNGFYNTSVGQNPDRASVVAHCRGDVQLNTCHTCIINLTAELLTSCTDQRGAVDWTDFCVLRYSNETIIGTMVTFPRMWTWNIQNATNPGEFMRALRWLLDDLRVQAAYNGSLRKEASGNITVSEPQNIYALVYCNSDLSQDDCSNCLIDAGADIPRCCNGRRGGRVESPSCNLRYESYSFLNESRLSESPPPSPLPPLALEPPGNHSMYTKGTIVLLDYSYS